MHPPGLRLPLGGRQERVSLPVPLLAVRPRWTGDLGTCAASPGSLPDEGGGHQALRRQIEPLRGAQSVRRRIRSFNDWVDHRTGIQTGVRKFLYEEIPASSGWHQIFGSVAVFLFMVQAFTGALLAFNYAPTPGDAYN